MKNIFVKLFCLFAFILSFALSSFAADLSINSVVYDNSAAFLTINSFDNDEYVFSAPPKLFILREENKAYFDINAAILKCSVQDLVITSPEVKEIVVSQFSTNPNIVRVVISYNEGYNPYNIQFKRINNSFYVTFKAPSMNNYYFQPVYAETAVPESYENTVIQSPVVASSNNMLGQINSAFNLGPTTEDKNFILSKKDMTLPTKFYIDNVNFKNNEIIVTGVGSLTLSKPIYLSNPARVAYDIPNSIVNPVIRNKDIKFNQTDSIKIGQFSRNTARIVITAQKPENYIPVIFGDTQRLVFINKTASPFQNMSSKANLTSAYDDINDLKSHTMKLVFSKPVIFGVDRTKTGLDLSFYNVDRYQDVDLKAALIFEGIKMTSMNDGGAKLSISGTSDDIFDIHLGSDGKTVRIKTKLNEIKTPIKEEPVIIVEPVVPQKIANKKYIVVDPGHGGSDCGATRNGIYEKDITLDVSKRVVALLEKKGYIVEMTRTKDETVSLQDRVEFSENVNPDIFVSIHVNSSNSESPNGLETHYYKDNSLRLAKNVHASLLNHINANDRGLFKSKFYVINHTTAPAILVEIGFISNASERAQIVSESRKQATAKAIAEGIYEYFK